MGVTNYLLTGMILQVGDKPIIFQATIFHFHDYGRKGNHRFNHLRSTSPGILQVYGGDPKSPSALEKRLAVLATQAISNNGTITDLEFSAPKKWHQNTKHPQRRTGFFVRSDFFFCVSFFSGRLFF